MEAAEGDKMNVREARKRRILETGSYRMALITGRIQSLPYSPRSPSLRRTLAESSSFSDRLSSNSNISGQSNASKIDKNDKSFNFNDIEHVDAMKQKSSFDEQAETVKKMNAEKDTIIIKEKKMKEEDTTKEIKCIAEHTVKANDEIIDQEDTHVKPLKQNNESGMHPKDATIAGEDEISRLSWTNAITPKLISSCITSSEPARSISSLVTALLVVSSQMDLVKYGSLIAWSPLYILLITNISIVVALLQLERKKAEREEEESLLEDGRSWGGAVKVLETGLVVYHSVRALFIDFSIYSVIVVCGLSFA